LRCVLLVLALVASCSRPPEASAFRLRIAVSGHLAPLDPHPQDSYSAFAQEWVYEPLVRLEADGSMKPALAVRLERIDSKSVRVWIRPETRFSDGSPVAAGDVVESVRSFNLDAWEKDGAVVIQSDAVLPETVLTRTLIYKRVPAAILGTGPYHVVEQDSSHILLRRTTRQPDHVDEVVVRSFPTPREAFLRTLLGDADAYPLVDPRQVEFFEGIPRFRVLRAPNVSGIAIALSPKRFDRDMRLALLAALHGPELARMADPGGCSPMQWGPASPRSLPPGRPLTIGCVSSAASQLDRMALAIQRALGPRGGEIEELSYAEQSRQLLTGDFDLLLEFPLVWPQTQMAMLWHTNSWLLPHSYSNPAVDAAIDSGDWAAALRDLQDDPPVDYICVPDRLAIVDARIKNARIGPFGFFETLPDWEITK